MSSSPAGPDVADSIPAWMAQRRVPGVALGILQGGRSASSEASASCARVRGCRSARHILLHTGAEAGVKTMIVLLPASGRGLVIFTTGDNGMDVALRIVTRELRLKDLTP